MIDNWTIFLFISFSILLFIIIYLFIRLNNRNIDYYNVIHSDLLSLVPLKIDLKKEIVTFSESLEVLNNKKRLSLFVFKSMINRKAKFDLEILFQDLLVNELPFLASNYKVLFQLADRTTAYDLTLDYYDAKNKVLYGQIQSNTRYNRFAVPEQIASNPSQLTVPKNDFVATIVNFFYSNQKKTDKISNLYEYIFLIKIKNYLNLESILTISNIEVMELLLTYYTKSLLGSNNTLICKYYDGEFLVYSKNRKINLSRFQKKIDHNIKNNLVDRSSYLQIQTEIIVVYSAIRTKETNINALYNKIIDVNILNSHFANSLIPIKLRPNESKDNGKMDHYQLLHSKEIQKLLKINLSPVYKTDDATEPKYYYVNVGLISNNYYDNYFNLIRNIQDAGLWWKVYEPLFLQALEDFEKLKIKKNLIIPIFLMELENKTVLTQIINIFNKKQNLFEDCNLVFDFQDNCTTVITNWLKYENTIRILREHNIKIAISHDFKNISNFKLISHFKPDLVILTANLLHNVTFNFQKYIAVITCLNYLNILGVTEIMALGVNTVPEVILLKSLNIKYVSGTLFEVGQVDKVIDSLNYSTYWSWKRSHNKKGNI
ncbi:MAG: EAL domain-containing protein [Spiroplasma sp.]|nr:EAL domain-containing protein [Spiroplasma sp.]